MPLPPGLAARLRAEGHDADRASERGLQTSADADLLQLAASEQRILVTADLDFPVCSPSDPGFPQV